MNHNKIYKIQVIRKNMKKEIIAPEVTVNEFRVESLNLEKKSMTVSFSYTARLKGLVNKARFNKIFEFNGSDVNFIFDTLVEIKQLAGTEKAKIENETEIKEKLVNTLSRLIREIKNLEKIKDSGEYMESFNKIHCYKAIFSESG